MTLPWHDLCRLMGQAPAAVTHDEVKAWLAAHHPTAQLCRATEGLPYSLVRVHNATLVSARAAVCVHLRPIAGDNNEIGSLGDLLAELHAAYGRTHLWRRLTTDAGNTSLAAMTQMGRYGWDYFAQIKTEHPNLYAEAARVLGPRRPCRAPAREVDHQNGRVVSYYAWTYDLGPAGWLDWTHARHLVCIRRVTEHPATGVKTTGDRYYVTSLAPAQLSPQAALHTCRAHWRCEDETHWTLNTELAEHQRRVAWSRHPTGALAAAVLRRIALAILAVARRLTRLPYTRESPTWRQVAEHFLLALAGTTLETVAFDNV